MTSLLSRQLRQCGIAADSQAGAWAELLATVSATYDEMEQDRRHLEHTLEVASDELNEANAQLRSETESQLKQLNAYYQGTLEGQLGMILCFREERGEFIHTLARRLGWTAETVEGRRLADFLAPEKAATFGAAYRRAWQGEECTVEGESPDGRIDYLARLKPRVGGGAVQEVILAGVEITDLKRIEAELRGAKERAESADRTKSEFLAVMSHEIRTPLHAIMGYTQLLKQCCQDPDQAQWIGTIDRSSRRLQELIDDILDYSIIEVGRLKTVQEPMSLNDVIQSVAASYRPAAEEKGLALDSGLSGGLPEVIESDMARVRQILANLVSNAVKFTAKGRITMGASAGSESQAGATRATIRFTVADSGIGIPKEMRERLFKPFTQVDSSTTRHYGGTGLGLAISRRLARALGGELDFVSEPGKGSIFTFTLPLVRVDSQE